MAVNVKDLYERYGPMVIRRCRALLKNEDEALDAAQDVFINVLKAGDKLENTYPSSLLYTIATNVCLNILKKRRRETSLPRSGDDDREEADIPVEDGSYGQIEAESVVQFLLKDEGESDKALLYMYHADGMTLKEIGEAVDLSVSGVRKRLLKFAERARKKAGISGLERIP
jgi:RNA polymerase sigma-70 factor (ECF subfamily)